MIDNLLHHGSIQIFSQNGPFHIKQFAFRQRSLNGIEGGGADVWLLEHRQTGLLTIARSRLNPPYLLRVPASRAGFSGRRTSLFPRGDLLA